MILKRVIYETMGDKTLYYREALDRDAWSLFHAVCLVSGLVPFPSITTKEMWEKHPVAALLLDEAIESCAVGVLKGGILNEMYYVTPRDFLLWLARKNWKLPPELIEVLGDNKLLYPSIKKTNKDSTPYYKQKIQNLGIALAEKVGRFSQEEIYHHEEMQMLLQNLHDPYGGKRKPFAKTTVKKWLSEVDSRQMNKRRGRPKKK